MSRRGNRSESSLGSSLDVDNGKKEQKIEKVEKSKRTEKIEKADKQAKIDEMMQRSKEDTKEGKIESKETQKEDSETDFDLKDVMKIVTRLERKVNELASKEYINTALETRLESLVSEKLFNDKLSSLKTDISNDIKMELDKVYEQIRSVKLELKTSESEMEHLKNRESDMKEEVVKVIEENERLKERNKDLNSKLNENRDRIKYSEYQLNELEQYTRRNSIRIYGMEDTDKNESPEKTQEKVVNLIKNKLGISIKVSDIDIAHRMGKFSQDGNRPVICKFVYRTQKQKIISVRKKLKGSSHVIREDLTLKNARLLEKLSAKEEVSNCWSDEGKVIALLTNGKKVKIDMYSNLDKSLLASSE